MNYTFRKKPSQLPPTHTIKYEITRQIKRDPT